MGRIQLHCKSQLFQLLLCGWLGILAGCDETILHELTEHEANRVVVRLSLSGISAKRFREGTNWNIQVKKSESESALMVLSRQKKMAERNPLSDVPRKSLVYSREERSYFLERSIASRLEETLMQVPGVLEARVHLYLKPTQLLHRSIQKPESTSASILLVVVTHSDSLRESAAQLVAGAAGIPTEKVKVVEVLDELQVAALAIAPKSVSGISSPKRLISHTLKTSLAIFGREHFAIQLISGFLLGVSLLIVRSRRRRREFLRRVVNGQK